MLSTTEPGGVVAVLSLREGRPQVPGGLDGGAKMTA